MPHLNQDCSGKMMPERRSVHKGITCRKRRMQLHSSALSPRFAAAHGALCLTGLSARCIPHCGRSLTPHRQQASFPRRACRQRHRRHRRQRASFPRQAYRSRRRRRHKPQASSAHSRKPDSSEPCVRPPCQIREAVPCFHNTGKKKTAQVRTFL